MTPDRANAGRKLLAEWKELHAPKLIEFKDGTGQRVCNECYVEVGYGEWPCPTARLIAAVEEALDALACHYECKNPQPNDYDTPAHDCEAQDRILAALTEAE